MNDKCEKCQRTIKYLKEQIEKDKLDLVDLKETDLLKIKNRIEDPELKKKSIEALNQMLEKAEKSGIALNDDGTPINMDQILERVMKEKRCTSNCDKKEIEDLRANLRSLELEIFEVELPLLMASRLKSDLDIDISVEDLNENRIDNEFIKKLWQELIAEVEMTDAWGPYELNALGFVNKLLLDYRIAKLKNHLSSKEQRNKDVDALFQKACDLGQEVLGGGVESMDSAFIEWLNSECIALGNMKPIDLLSSKNADGLQLLIDELGRIEYGVCS